MPQFALHPDRERFFGHDAYELPGREILPTLDPRLYIENRQNILIPPGDDRYVVRIESRTIGEGNPEDALRLAWKDRIFQGHLRMLSACGGIAIATHRSFVAELPYNLGHRWRDKSGLVSVVRRLPKDPLASVRDPAGIPIVSGLVNYLTRIITSKQNTMMTDIYDHEQYFRTSMGYYGELVDIERLFYLTTRTMFQDKLDMVQFWHKKLEYQSQEERETLNNSLIWLRNKSKSLETSPYKIRTKFNKQFLRLLYI